MALALPGDLGAGGLADVRTRRAHEAADGAAVTAPAVASVPSIRILRRPKPMQREASQHRRLGKARIKTGIAPDALGVALVEPPARALWLFRAVGKGSAPLSLYRACW
jgi:hypothetical protein